MVPNRPLAGLLALGSLLLAAAGEGLVLSHTAGAAGLVLLGYAPLAAAAAWLALGAPRTRRDLRV
jgi:hypothetical protein